MTPKERLLKVLNREPVDRPPVAPPTQNATVEAMDRVGVHWPEALREAEPMARLALGVQQVCGFESIRLPFDINVEAETMGCAMRYGGPSDPPTPAQKTREQLDSLAYPDPAAGGRMARVIEAVGIASSERDPELPLIAALGTPFEVLCTVYGFEQLHEDLADDAARIHSTLEKILDLLTDYGRALARAGADVLMVVDGTSQTLMPDQFREFSAPYAARLIQALDKPAILHVCGAATRLIADMAKTGAKALSIDQQVPPARARTDAGNLALVGNLDVSRLYLGTPEDAACMALDARAAGFDIVAPGCGIIPQTPLENIAAYVDTVKGMG
ncbi:MAG: MtaA/CmuA family methyltransferase [Nitrospinae bacterium]|nr:MtaA/CmuA family methyltransferase [Nitrospinota bacterium]